MRVGGRWEVEVIYEASVAAKRASRQPSVHKSDDVTNVSWTLEANVKKFHK